MGNSIPAAPPELRLVMHLRNPYGALHYLSGRVTRAMHSPDAVESATPVYAGFAHN